MIYVRFSPGVSLQDAADKLNAMGKALEHELPEGAVEMVVANIGTPQNARSAIVSPNTGRIRASSGWRSPIRTTARCPRTSLRPALEKS